MATGPLLPKINDGDPLLGSKMRDAFSALQDFMGSFPVDNLERYKFRETVNLSHGTITADSEVYLGYQQLTDGGGTATGDNSKLTKIDAYAQYVGTLGAGDATTITFQTASVIGGTWTTIATVVLDSSSSNVASHNTTEGGADVKYGYIEQEQPGLAITPGYYWRVHVSVAKGGNDLDQINIAVEFETKLQP